MFALHHWTPTDWDYLQDLCEGSNCNPHIKCLKVVQENGGEGETPHLQGCVAFSPRTFKKQRPSAISKILMGPNKDIALPDPQNPGKTLGHHYHVDGMRGTLAEAADYCGNTNKEANCVMCECGEIPVSQQGKDPQHQEAQELIKKYAREGLKFSAIEELIPKFADKSNAWMRTLCN